MEKIALITDSCADIPAELRNKYDIHVVPLIIQTIDGEYKDTVNISAKDVYQRQQSEMLKTSSPQGEDITNTIEEVFKKGYTHAFIIPLSSGLSGTFNQFRLLALDYDNVEVIDAHNGSIGNGVIVLQMAKYIEQGKSFEELSKIAKTLASSTKAFFSIPSLELLEKGGRIGKAAYLLGSVVNIVPILSFAEDGQISAVAKVRGTKKMITKLVSLCQKELEENPGRKYNICIAHGANEEGFEVLKTKIQEAFPNCEDLIEAQVGATLSVYLGQGMLGAAIQFID